VEELAGLSRKATRKIVGGNPTLRSTRWPDRLTERLQRLAHGGIELMN
jgi:hypothetical protein